VAVSTAPAPAELWKQFSGDRAWRTAKELAGIGPRPAGSQEIGRERALLIAALESAGWEVEQETFDVKTASESFQGTNLIARFSADGSRPVPRTARNVLLGAHYDTRRFSTIRFLGANDGASGPAVLVETARVLSLDPQLAAKVEIALFDASEPRIQFTPEDGIAGSKHHARSGAPAHAVILHGVGAANEPFTLPPETSAEVLGAVKAATAAVHSPLQFKTAQVRLWGDHLPFGAGALLLGTYDSLIRYTADDTVEHLDSATLGRVGELVIWLAKRWAGQ
jgi:hypothetical protein